MKTLSIEILGVRIEGLDREINCFAIYRRPGTIENRNTWRIIIDNLKKLKNVLLVGDFNAHNTIWNCGDTDKNGEILQKEMEEEGFFVINRNSKSRISEGGSLPSNIDLMFCSEDIFEIITYKQIEDTWESDHYPIEFKIEINKKRYVKLSNKITTKKTDWLIYKRELKNNENTLRTKNFQTSCMQERYRIIIEIIKKAVKEASSIKTNMCTPGRCSNTGRKETTGKKKEPLKKPGYMVGRRV